MEILKKIGVWLLGALKAVGLWLFWAIAKLVLWVACVVLGVGVCLAIVMGVSYYYTTETALPDGEVLLEEVALTENGSHWRVPLIGAVLDKTMETGSTLTVEKAGTFTIGRPQFTLPTWANEATLAISNSKGTVVFEGTQEEYAQFVYPANDEYKAELHVWHLPEGQTIEEFNAQKSHAIMRNHDKIGRAQPSGWYRYLCRYTINTAPTLTLSEGSAVGGDVVALHIDGILSDVVPEIETDLGTMEPIKYGSGWRIYLPITYNTEGGMHTIKVTVDEMVLETELKVLARDFGKSILTAPEAVNNSETANEEYRALVWAEFDGPSTPKAWYGTWLCPLEKYTIAVEYGATKIFESKSVGTANCVEFATDNNSVVRAPANGTVVLAQELALSGNTMIIDHGCGVRSYFFGMKEMHLKKGDSVISGTDIGTTGTSLTYDVKISNKSISPWDLFRGQGGLFWEEVYEAPVESEAAQ